MRTLTLLLIAALAGNALAQTTIPAKPVTGSPAMNAPVMNAPAMNAPAMNQMPMAPMTPVKMGSAMMNGRIPASGTIENYARTMIGAMDALGLKTATVGGMSMGGMTLLQMYKLAPTRFNGLVFIDTTAEPAGVAEAASWRGTAQQAQQIGVASIVPGILPRMLTGEDRMKMPAQVAFLSGLVKQASLNGVVGGGNALAARPDANAVLPTIKVPTLLVFGLEDNLTPVELAMKMQQGIAGSRLVLIPGGGHATTFEKASATNAAIISWAKTLK